MSLPPESDELDVQAIADAFLQARKSHAALTEFPGGSIPASLALGYAIQAAEINAWDDEVVGWKVGGVAPHLQEKYAETRVAGPVFKQAVYSCDKNGTVQLPVFAGGCSAVEAEYIFELGDLAELPAKGVTIEQAVGAIKRVFVGYENASSPLDIGNDIGPLGPISDFGLNNGIVVGPELENWTKEDILSIPVTAHINGEFINTAAAKDGADGPFGAVKFLIEFLKQHNYNSEAGVLVSSGALTGVHKAYPGDVATIAFGDKATFTVELVDSRQL